MLPHKPVREKLLEQFLPNPQVYDTSVLARQTVTYSLRQLVRQQRCDLINKLLVINHRL